MANLKAFALNIAKQIKPDDSIECIAEIIEQQIESVCGIGFSEPPAASGVPSESQVIEMLNACGTTMRANDLRGVADKMLKLFAWHRGASSEHPCHRPRGRGWRRKQR